MNNPSSSRISETDWERVSAMTDAEIDLSDIVETTAEQMARSTFRINRVPVERKQESVQLIIDSFVLDCFKAKAGESGLSIAGECGINGVYDESSFGNVELFSYFFHPQFSSSCCAPCNTARTSIWLD